jgi:hypothetical protein
LSQHKIIKARFVEAAATERFLSADMPGSGRSYWPVFAHDAEDIKGWDDQAKIDNASWSTGRASRGEIARHTECLDWTVRLIRTEMRRRVVWAWAFCRAYNRDFSKLCDRKGWKRGTSYQRLDAAVADVDARFHDTALLVAPPSERWYVHEEPLGAQSECTLGEQRRSATAILNQPYVTEKPRDLLATAADVDAFQAFLEHRNEVVRQRQAREEKRRAKLGALGVG